MANKRLFLASSGFAPETNTEFLKLMGKEPTEILIGFIPTASDVEENRQYVQMDLDSIAKLGMQKIVVDLKNENADSLYQKLNKCDVILVEGGNTFYLLDWIRKSGFDKALQKLLSEGKVYYGISAGSYVASPNISAAGWNYGALDVNIPKLKDLTGLNLVPFIFTAHYNNEKYQHALKREVSNTNLPVVALYDTQAIKVIDDKYEIVGTGPKEFFNGFKENL